MSKQVDLNYPDEPFRLVSTTTEDGSKIQVPLAVTESALFHVPVQPYPNGRWTPKPQQANQPKL